MSSRTPATTVARLCEAIVQVARSPAFADYLAKNAMTPDLLGSRALREAMANDAVHWKRVYSIARGS